MTRDLPHILVPLLFWFMFVISCAVTAVNVKGLLIEEYMKRSVKNEKQESDNALFVSEGKSSYHGNFQTRGGAGHSCSGRFQNFNFNPQASYNDRDQHRDVKCFKCNQDGHIVKNCPYNNKQNTGKRESSNMAELEGVALISSMMNKSNERFIDSAATKHMTSNKSILENQKLTIQARFMKHLMVNVLTSGKKP